MGNSYRFDWELDTDVKEVNLSGWIFRGTF